MFNFFVNPKHSIIIVFFLLLFLTLFAKTAQAQPETEFVKNDLANPLQRLMVTSGRQSRPQFVDIDNDGDLDCFSGEFNYSRNGVVSSHISFFKNEGDGKHPLFKEIQGTENPLNAIAITGLLIPFFADIDGDGDEDCFVADNAGTITFYENTGNAKVARFEKQSAAFNPLSLVKFSGIAISNFILTDADADGDLDCLITDEDGNEAYFKNTGSAYQPRFVSTNQQNDPFAFINHTAINNISLCDWNKDGRTDVFVNEKYYQNNIDNFSTCSHSPSINNSNDIATCWVDLNNDGTFEMVSGTSDGKFVYRTVASVTVKAITSIKVSPNPTTKSFTVYFTPSTDKRTLQIVNADGKIMSSQNINASSYAFGDTFAPGVYFVMVISSDKKVAEQQVIKL